VKRSIRCRGTVASVLTCLVVSGLSVSASAGSVPSYSVNSSLTPVGRLSSCSAFSAPTADPSSAWPRCDLVRSAAPTTPAVAVPHSPLPVCVNQLAGVNDRCETWARRYNDPSPYSRTITDRPAPAVISPRGDRFFLATTTSVDGGQARSSLAAVSTSSGATLWVAHSPTSLPTTSGVVALTGDGTHVVSAGTVSFRPNLNAATVTYWLTSAYSASTGQRLWTTMFDTGAESNFPVAAVPSPRGDFMYVTGESIYGGRAVPFIEWVTIAYSMRTGKQAWIARYEGIAGGQNWPVGIAISPRGDRLFVAGRSEHPTLSPTQTWDYTVISYSTHKGRELWHRSSRHGTQNIPVAMALGPRGDRVFVTGAEQSGPATQPIWSDLTIAYAGSSGRELWAARHSSSTGQVAVPTALAVSRRGDRLYVAGADAKSDAVVPNTTVPGTPNIAFANMVTQAYDTATGKGVWVHQFAPPGDYSSQATAITLSSSGRDVYVGGILGPAGAVGYSVLLALTSSGVQRWVTRSDVRDPTSPGLQYTVSVFVAPSGRNVYTVQDYQPLSDLADADICGVGPDSADCRHGPKESAMIAGFSS
jgi:hypothetical protein